MKSHRNFKLRFSEKSLNLVRGFYFVRIEKFGLHGYSSNRKLTIAKQAMSNWPGSDGKMTSHYNFKLRLSKRSLDLGRGFLFQFGVI